MWSPVKRRKKKTRSWRECHHLITAGEVTETWTSPVALPHYGIGGAGVDLPEGGVGLPKEEAPPLAAKGIGARVQDVTVAGLVTDGTDPVPSPQVITVVTDTGATQNLLKDLRKATRRAGEGMSNGLSLVLVQMAFCGGDSICVGEQMKIYSPGSYGNILDLFFNTKFLHFFFFFLMKEVLSFVSLFEL